MAARISSVMREEVWVIGGLLFGRQGAYSRRLRVSTEIATAAEEAVEVRIIDGYRVVLGGQDQPGGVGGENDRAQEQRDAGQHEDAAGSGGTSGQVIQRAVVGDARLGPLPCPGGEGDATGDERQAKEAQRAERDFRDVLATL